MSESPLPYGRQHISEEDIEAVVEVLRSDWITQGPAIERFEKAVAAHCGARHAVAVCNGTAALHLACLALGLGRTQALWTVPTTFVASANCARYCGAAVDFVDIRLDTGNLNVEALERKLAAAEREGRLPSIVMPAHFAGQPCELAPVHELSRRYGFAVVEDACHALGARYRDSRIGDCTYSDLAVFSFHPVKTITSGEGGMILTNRRELFDRLRLLRSHGITREPGEQDGPADGPWQYWQTELGYNYRMTDFQATLGTSQMGRLDAFIERRHAVARRYAEALADLPLDLPQEHPDAFSAYHLYVVRLHDNARIDRLKLYQHLRKCGILAQVHYIPVHLQPYYRELGFRPGDFPMAERHYAQALSLPMFPAMSEADQERVIASVREALVC